MTDWISEEGLIKYRWSAWQGPGAPSRLPHLETEYRLGGLSRGNPGQMLLSREGKVRETACYCSRHLLEAGQKFFVERSHELPRSLHCLRCTQSWVTQAPHASVSAVAKPL